jgi:hypothetical protein
MLSGYHRATTSGAQERSHEPRQDRLAVYLYDGPVVVDEDDIPDRSHRAVANRCVKIILVKAIGFDCR